MCYDPSYPGSLTNPDLDHPKEKHLKFAAVIIETAKVKPEKKKCFFKKKRFHMTTATCITLIN